MNSRSKPTTTNRPGFPRHTSKAYARFYESDEMAGFDKYMFTSTGIPSVITPHIMRRNAFVTARGQSHHGHLVKSLQRKPSEHGFEQSWIFGLDPFIGIQASTDSNKVEHFIYLHFSFDSRELFFTGRIKGNFQGKAHKKLSKFRLSNRENVTVYLSTLTELASRSQLCGKERFREWSCRSPLCPLFPYRGRKKPHVRLALLGR